MEQAQVRLAEISRHLAAAEQPAAVRSGGRFTLKGPPQGPPIVLGAMVLDVQAQASSGDIEAGGTVPGSVRQNPGGVGRNVAHALGQLSRGKEWKPLLISIVGSDAAGMTLLGHWRACGFSAAGIVTSESMSTPAVVYCFKTAKHLGQHFQRHADGSVAAGVAAVADFEAAFTPALVHHFRPQLCAAPLLILDANLPSDVIEEACRCTQHTDGIIWFETVSSAKAVRATEVLQHLAFASPNVAELIAMSNAARRRQGRLRIETLADGFAGSRTAHAEISRLAPHIQTLLEAGLQNVVLTMGSLGAALCRQQAGAAAFEAHSIPAEPVDVATTSGAGDCFVAGACMRLLEGRGAVSALAYGMAAACICVQSSENVPPALERRLVCDLADTMLQKCTTMSVPYTRKSKVVREEVDVGLADCVNTLPTGDVFTSDSRQLPATD